MGFSLVKFELIKEKGGKTSCLGSFDYTMVRLETRRAERIPPWIQSKYSI